MNIIWKIKMEISLLNINIKITISKLLLIKTITKIIIYFLWIIKLLTKIDKY